MRDAEESRHIAYQVRQYLSHLSDDALEERACQLYLNRCLEPPIDSLVNAPPMGWEGLWRDAVDETYRRFGNADAKPFVERVEATCVRSWDSRPGLPDEQIDDFLRRTPKKWDLVRYSKRRYLQDLVSHGRMRIAPAASYNDPSLNPAIRDDELTFGLSPNPSEIKLEAFDGKTGKYKGNIHPIGPLTIKLQTNYYVYCMSGFLSPQLFHDFGADACLIITDLNTFAGRLLNGLNARLPYPTWGGKIQKVSYLDPLHATYSQVGVLFSKHFSYAYQQEWRLVCYPASPTSELDPFYLELGRMADCCAVLSL
jgi:hypothetical protein